MSSKWIANTVGMVVMTAFLVGCSQQSQTLSEQKGDIDRQRELQKQLVERRADELKETVEEKRRLAQQQLDAENKQLDIQKKLNDENRRNIDKRADFMKGNLDQQEASSKKVVDRNAELAKDRLEQYARTTH